MGEENVIQFPENVEEPVSEEANTTADSAEEVSEPEADGEQTEETVESTETTEETPMTEEDLDKKIEDYYQIDPENPLASLPQIENLLQNMQSIVSLLQQNWMTTSRELGIEEKHIRLLNEYNDKHGTPLPKDLSEEERANWDYWNGITNDMSDEDIEAIFGKDHKIYGLSHEATIDRIKTACNDFSSWVNAMSDYRNTHDAYLRLLELEEDQEILKLKQQGDEETDPEKKAQIDQVIDRYYYNKYMRFLADPMSPKDRDYLLSAFNDSSKLEYWIKRSRDKLKRLQISDKFILELSQFEKRFLEEKYWKNNNILLTWFLRTCAYCKTDDADKQDPERVKVVCCVMGFDAVIRKQWPQERIDEVLNNVRVFEDQFLPYTKEPEEHHETTPPIEDELLKQVTSIEDEDVADVPESVETQETEEPTEE